MTERLASDLDANWVIGTLWQGSVPRLRPNLCQVDVIVLAAKEFQGRTGPRGKVYTYTPDKYCNRKIRVIRAPLDDGGAMTKSEMQYAVRAAWQVRECLDEGYKVLSTCWAGMNRSGLISAIALMLPARQYSMTPGALTSDQAIFLVRRARGERALSNPYFVSFLEHLEWVGGSVRGMAM